MNDHRSCNFFTFDNDAYITAMAIHLIHNFYMALIVIKCTNKNDYPFCFRDTLATLCLETVPTSLKVHTNSYIMMQRVPCHNSSIHI